MGGQYCDHGYWEYQIVVGNLGTVYDGPDLFKAHEIYQSYCIEADESGREVSGQSVHFISFGEVSWHKESTHEEVSED
jgi:hypothetical protein